jgi:hypothetical protein
MLVLLSASAWAQHPLDIRHTLTALSSADEEKREEAVTALATRIQADPVVRARADVQLALARLIRSEGRTLIREAFQGFEPDSDLYDWQIVPAAMSILSNTTSTTKPVVVRALVESGIFNSGSRLAQAIGAVGKGAVPAMLRASRERSSNRRANTFDLLGWTLANHRAGTLRQPLSAKSATAARRAIIRGLRDRDIVCRREAVQGVERAGLKEALPILRELAATDPDDGRAGNGRVRYSVRGLAAQAIETLSKEP